jgi:hypothetical protein
VNVEPELLATVFCPMHDAAKDGSCRRAIGHFVRHESEMWFVHPEEGHRATRVSGRQLRPGSGNDWIFVDHDVFECRKHNRLSKIDGRLVTRDMLIFPRELVFRASRGKANELVPRRYVPIIRDDVSSHI